MPMKLKFITKEWLTNQLYNKTLIAISKEFNIGRTTLNRYINNYNLQLINHSSRLKYRKYYFNENYFENINTENKAYWLGFIFADGCVYSHNYSISIDLNKKDEYHLMKFLKDIDSKHHLYYDDTKNAVICRISSEKLQNDLINLGCCSNKSLIIQLPKIDYNLYQHFIRGYFDGDGCITKSCSGQWKAHINSGSKIFLEQINNMIAHNIDLFRKIAICSKNCYRLDYSGIKNIYLLYHYLYNHSTIYLDRKFVKYQQFLEKYNESII